MRLSNFNLRLDLIKTSFFEVLTYLDGSGGKSYMILKKKSAQSVHFYRFYGHLKFCLKIDLHIKHSIKTCNNDQNELIFFSKLFENFSPDLKKMVRTKKNKVLMRSSHKLRFERRKYIHSIEQPLISLDLKYFMIKVKLRYLRYIL